MDESRLIGGGSEGERRNEGTGGSGEDERTLFVPELTGLCLIAMFPGQSAGSSPGVRRDVKLPSSPRLQKEGFAISFFWESNTYYNTSYNSSAIRSVTYVSFQKLDYVVDPKIGHSRMVTQYQTECSVTYVYVST